MVVKFKTLMMMMHTVLKLEIFFQFSLHSDLNSMIHGKINTVIDSVLLAEKIKF